MVVLHQLYVALSLCERLLQCGGKPSWALQGCLACVQAHAVFPPSRGLAAQVIRDKITNHSRGFAFVTFAHPHAASWAHAQLNGVTMYGPFAGRALRLGASNRSAAAAEE